MAGDAQLRTRVIRYLRDEDGEERSVPEIADGTGLSKSEVQRGIDHNLFVDSLKPNLYYGVIAKREGAIEPIYRFNAAQYMENRSRWTDAHGKERKRGGSDILGDLKDIRLPNPLKWIGRKGGKQE